MLCLTGFTIMDMECRRIRQAIERMERRTKNLPMTTGSANVQNKCSKVPALQRPSIYRCSPYLRNKLAQCLQYVYTAF